MKTRMLMWFMQVLLTVNRLELKCYVHIRLIIYLFISRIPRNLLIHDLYYIHWLYSLHDFWISTCANLFKGIIISTTKSDATRYSSR